MTIHTPSTRITAIRDELQPIVLVGANSLRARPFVDHALRHLNVVAIHENNPAARFSTRVPVLTDADVPAFTAAHPQAVPVYCCGSAQPLAHFRSLWEPASPPGLLMNALLPALATRHDLGEGLNGLAAFSDPVLIERIRDTLRPRLADQLSRSTLDAVLDYRLSWDLAGLSSVALPLKDMYFGRDVLSLTDDEVYVDGGAYDGDSVRDFIAATNGRYAHIHAFEFDSINYAAMDKSMANTPNLTLHATGLWSEATEMTINMSGGMGSALAPNGTARVRLEALDDVVQGRVSLFKLDIEGAESQALQGANRIITTHKPKMAISAYHLADDLITLPARILALRPDYRLRLRHYSPIIVDTILYAD